MSDSYREVYPGIHRISLPMPGPLEQVHTYLIRGEKENLLVDTAWDLGTAWGTLKAGFAAAGLDPETGPIHKLLITHIHPDHIGMAARIQEQFAPSVYINTQEALFLEPRYEQAGGLLAEMNEWLRSAGAPEDHVAALRDASVAMTGLHMPKPDHFLHGGEIIDIAPFSFEVIWTPGHSPGHIALYEREKKIWIGGDHVLPNETPNISLHPQSSLNPLADYLDSLHEVSGLEVELALAGHGVPFSDFGAKIDYIRAHHERRLAQALATLKSGPKSAWEVCSGIAWHQGKVQFEKMFIWDQRLAFLEILAHMEYLRLSAGVRKSFIGGVARYYLD